MQKKCCKIATFIINNIEKDLDNKEKTLFVLQNMNLLLNVSVVN